VIDNFIQITVSKYYSDILQAYVRMAKSLFVWGNIIFTKPVMFSYLFPMQSTSHQLLPFSPGSLCSSLTRTNRARIQSTSCCCYKTSVSMSARL